MIKTINFLILSIFSLNTFACGDVEEVISFEKYYGAGGVVFNLAIEMSFDGNFEFTMVYEDCKYSLVTTRTISSYDEKTKTVTESEITYHRDLDEKKAEVIIHKLNKALSYDAKEFYVGGRDGSRWCLNVEKQRYYRNACFWTPSYKQRKRRLKHLFQLGEHLVKASRFSAEIKELY